MVWLAVYPLYIFTDYQLQLGSKEVHGTGWYLVSIFATNVAFNILIFMIVSLKAIWFRIKVWYIRMQKKREMAKRLKEKQKMQ